MAALSAGSWRSSDADLETLPGKPAQREEFEALLRNLPSLSAANENGSRRNRSSISGFQLLLVEMEVVERGIRVFQIEIDGFWWGR